MSRRPLALVTGGCRRLGAAVAAKLATAGWALALHGGHDAELEAALALTLARMAVEWRAFEASFDDPVEATRLFNQVVGAFGRAPDLLVNGASLFGQDTLETVTADELMRHYAVNCVAPTLLMQAFAAAGGEGRSVVNILDQRIEQPHRDQLAYTLSKLALEGLTRIGARTLGPAIRVNAVAPGLTLPTGDYDERQMERLAARMPLARLPGPDEIAEAVLYLATAPGVTGQTLYVDAGARFVPFDRDFMHLER